MRLAVAIALLTLMVPGLSFAEAPVVGVTVIGGKRVELLGDNTWRYAEVPEVSGNCVPVKPTLSFCGSIIDWRPISVRSTEFTRILKHDAKHFAGIIYEELGTADGITLSGMQNTVVETAADASGVPPSEILIDDVRDEDLDEIPTTTIGYTAVIDGLEVSYRNTLILGENRVIQLLTWAVNDPPSEKRTPFHQRFLDAIALEPEAAE